MEPHSPSEWQPPPLWDIANWGRPDDPELRCPICQVSVAEDTDGYWSQTPCEHWLHAQCLMDAMQHDTRCPACRTELGAPGAQLTVGRDADNYAPQPGEFESDDSDDSYTGSFDPGDSDPGSSDSDDSYTGSFDPGDSYTGSSDSDDSDWDGEEFPAQSAELATGAQRGLGGDQSDSALEGPFGTMLSAGRRSQLTRAHLALAEDLEWLAAREADAENRQNLSARAVEHRERIDELRNVEPSLTEFRSEMADLEDRAQIVREWRARLANPH